MSLACLVCHNVESPSHSLRSYSVSSSDNEGRCSAIGSCLTWKASLPLTAHHAFASTAKVTPQPNIQSNTSLSTAPCLVRSCALRRDLVRDWNFTENVIQR